MPRILAVMAASLLALIPIAAQTPQSSGKLTENVIIRYERAVARGALLTPEGWRATEKLFAESHEFPRGGEISLMSIGGSLGETWRHDNKAEVETKWTDYFGMIDSLLRFHPPEVRATMTAYVFHLVYTNKHRDIGKNGEIIREVTGPWEWKIEDPQKVRWSTLDRAVGYVTAECAKTDDPVVKKSALKTIAALKRQGRPCGSASAC